MFWNVDLLTRGNHKKIESIIQQVLEIHSNNVKYSEIFCHDETKLQLTVNVETGQNWPCITLKSKEWVMIWMI